MHGLAEEAKKKKYSSIDRNLTDEGKTSRRQNVKHTKLDNLFEQIIDTSLIMLFISMLSQEICLSTLPALIIVGQNIVIQGFLFLLFCYYF